MPLPAITPTGTVNTAEDIYIEGGPDVYFGGEPQYSPDDDGFYHGVVGTTDNPVYRIGCYENFVFGESVTVNEVRCDNLGLTKVTQERDYLTVEFVLKSLLPLTQLTHILKASAVTIDAVFGVEKMGIGPIDNDQFWMVYFARIYDDDAGDYVAVTGHRCQFVEAWQIATPYAQPWTVSGVRLRFFADDTKPAAQRFATVIRVDPSVLAP